MQHISHRMKRKLLSFEDQKATKTAKMMEIDMEANDSLLITNVSNVSSSLSQHFNFEMSDQKAKSNFIKGASREALEVEEKQKCSMMIFSVGAYLATVIPAVEKWTNATVNTKISNDVIIEKVVAGYDENNKHLQTILKFGCNKESITVTCYNTTQKVKIEGKGYLDFAQNFMEPFFKQKLSEEAVDKIDKYNRDVIASLSGKRKAVSRPMRSVKYKASAKLPCSKCEVTFSNNVQLSKHKLIVHTREQNDSIRSFKNFPIVDNISLLDVTNEEEEVKALTLVESVTTKETNFEVHTRQDHGTSLSCDNVKRDTCDQTCDKGSNLDSQVNSQHYDSVPPQSQKLQNNIVEIENATFYCKTCGKDFEEFDLLVEHSVAKHDEVPGIKCDRCDKSFPDYEAIGKHVVELHTFDEVNTQELKQSDFKCSLCGKVIRTKLGIQRHVELFCEECQKCSAERVSFDIHKKLHTIKPVLKCEKCDFTTIDAGSLNSHIQTIHKVVRIAVDIKDQVMIKCEHCEYKCKLNIQLKKHHKTVHEGKEQELKYNCDACDYSTNFVLDLCKHREAEHPEKSPIYKPNTKDMALSLLAEQNMDIIEDLGSLKTLFKGVFLEFADKVGSVLENVRDEVLVHSSETKSKVEELDSKLDQYLKVEQQKAENNSAEKYNKTTDEKTYSAKVGTKTEKTQKCVAWIGTSVSKVLNRKKFEEENEVKLKMFTADVIDEEAESGYPKFHNNFKKVVPKVLNEENFDAIVLEAGSKEISDINVNEAVMDTKEDLLNIKKQWFARVEEDSKKIFEIAEEAVAKNSKLKVIIIKRLPRYDKSSQDILGIKSQLSVYANNVYDQLLLQSSYSSNIHVMEINMELQNSSYIRKLIYGDITSEQFDGIHLKGDGASRHLTYRAVQAMKPILCSKGRKVKVFDRFLKNERNSRRTFYTSETKHSEINIPRPANGYLRGHGDHTDCDQARYARGQASAAKITYAQAVIQGGPSYRTYTGGNIYNHLNC